MIAWARNLEAQVSGQLKLHEGDIEELRETLRGFVQFFQMPGDPGATKVKQIGKDLFLVHRAEGEKHEPKKS